jgi:transcriptional regulator with XRE-family HTH domain
MKPHDLATWRKQQGLGVEALAALLGVHRQTVWQWETGRRAIPAYLELALRQLEQTSDSNRPHPENGTGPKSET